MTLIFDANMQDALRPCTQCTANYLFVEPAQQIAGQALQSKIVQQKITSGSAMAMLEIEMKAYIFTKLDLLYRILRRMNQLNLNLINC